MHISEADSQYIKATTKHKQTTLLSIIKDNEKHIIGFPSTQALLSPN